MVGAAAGAVCGCRGAVVAVFVALSLLADNYNLNNIKSRTVGDGQHGNQNEEHHSLCLGHAVIVLINIVGRVDVQSQQLGHLGGLAGG